MLIGAHVSISGGIDLALGRGEAIGANCIQTFASSPRTLQFSPFSPEVVERYLERKKNSSIKFHVFHGIYLVNLASDKEDNLKRSIDSLVKYQQAAKSIGAIGTIFHVGSHKGAGFDSAKVQVVAAINSVLSESPQEVTLILENAAGHKGTIGQTTDELAQLFNKVRNADRLGLCLDTQHAFASGVDGRNKESVDVFLEEIDKKIGLEYIKVVHANDSKTLFDSHHDRHENIGDGYLGKMGMSNWVNHPRLTQVPFILEVPGIFNKGPEAEDIKRLKDLCKTII
jgi:deoxyribonuclease-4